MRTSSVLKTMAFWFVVPVVVVGAAGYTWLNQPGSTSAPTDIVTDEDLGALNEKKQFAPPAVEVNSKVGSNLRSRGRLIGKRPRKKKPVVPTAEVKTESNVGPPPILDPPPTSSPVDGG